jgi:predicted O-methyltransferase YrrM
MNTKSPITDENVALYVTNKVTQDSSLESRLRAETMRLPNGGMISPSDVGALLALFVKILNGRNLLEVGTFTGYTALKMAQALPAGGRLICCDVNEEWTAMGRKFWKEAGVADKVDLRLAPALETLQALLKEGQQGRFDFAFIDADKTGYGAYYEACLELIRPGGMIVLDNMLRGGRVADFSNKDESVVYLRQLNADISKDTRVEIALLTVGDGLMVVRKK